MNCAETDLRLQELLDSRASLDADGPLADHLESCTRCATLAAAYQVLACPPTPPSTPPIERLAARVLADVATPRSTSTGQQTPNFASRAWPAAVLAASVMVAVVLVRGQADVLQSPTQQVASTEASAVAPTGSTPEFITAVRDERGRRLMVRTGVDLASIYLVGMRWPSPITISETTAAGGMLLPSVDDTLRRWWPVLKDAAQPQPHESRLGKSLAWSGVV